MVKVERMAEQLAKLYIDSIVRHHRISKEIVSDKDPLFTSYLLRAFKQAMGTKIKLSTIYHTQIDGQSERTI